MVIQYVLIVRARLRPGLPGSRIWDARNVLIGQNRVYSGQGACLGNIYFPNNRVGMRAGQNTRVEHATQLDIISKGGLAGSELHSVYLALRLAHYVQAS